MGLFDRLLGRASPSPRASTTPVSPPAPATDTGAGSADPAAPSPVAPRLLEARECLEVRDLPGAMAIYEEVLAAAGERPDVLVTISGDLGSTGHVEQIIELIAPRYDAERHGPATGINLLQAYLAARQPQAAQHVLDLLFALKNPAIEDRLWGFSNAIGEMIEAQRSGSAPGGGPAVAVSLVSISKPIWAYGIEDLPGLLPSKAEPLRRVAFGQLATPGLKDTEERQARPEDSLGRFARGFPLWLAETLYFSRTYAPIAAIGLMERAHYALFPNEWTTTNLKQLVETAGEPPDYVLTGAIEDQSGDFHLTLRLWEVKKFRERKTFEARWTPGTADAELAKLHEQLRLFFEWAALPAEAALPYAPPARPTAWIDTLGASLSLFLADKGVLPTAQLTPLPQTLAAADNDPAAALAALTLADRAQRLGMTPPELSAPPDHALVHAARTRLGTAPTG
jgi:hypothetical protein